jgi:hypothetical protein
MHFFIYVGTDAFCGRFPKNSATSTPFTCDLAVEQKKAYGSRFYQAPAGKHAETKVLPLALTSGKVRPDAHGCYKNSEQAIRKSCGGWTKIHAITTADAAFVKFNLSVRNAFDAKRSVGFC